MFTSVPSISKSLWVFVFFFILIFVTYNQSLTHEFMLDDHGVLLAMEPGLAQVSKALDITDAGRVFYRPVSQLFRLFLVSTVPLNPVYYHVLNFGLFAVFLTLMFKVFQKLLNRIFPAFLVCLLFALHPVNGIFINYITAHEVLLYGIFLALSALFLLRFCDDFTKRRYQLVSLLFFVLAIFTQEISIVFLLFVFLLTFHFLKNISNSQAFRVCLPFVFVVFVYFVWRMVMLSQTSQYIQRMFEHSSGMQLDVWTYINTVLHLISWYIVQLIDASELILIKILSAQSEGVIFNLSVLLFVVIFVFWFLGKRGKSNAFVFSILWFLSGFIPLFALALIYPYAGFVIEPHWFFFSSMGFFLCLGLVFEFLLSCLGRSPGRFLVFILISLLATFWFQKAQFYNQIWRTQESYCRYWLSITPNFYFPNFWLARDLFKQNKLEESEVHFKRALIGKNNDWLVYAGLGDIEAVRGDFLKTRQYYLEALRLNPDSAFLKKNVEWLEQNLPVNTISQ